MKLSNSILATISTLKGAGKTVNHIQIPSSLKERLLQEIYPLDPSKWLFMSFSFRISVEYHDLPSIAFVLKEET